MPETGQEMTAKIALLQNIGFRGFFTTENYTYMLQGFTPNQYIIGFNLIIQETEFLEFMTPIMACTRPMGLKIPITLKKLGFN